MAEITAKLIEIQNTSSSVYTAIELSEYEVEYNKLWKDADRNMDGQVRATLIGIFPKLVCKTPPVRRSTAATLGNLLNQPYFNVKFFDTLTGTVLTAQYYAGDYGTELMQRCGEWYNEISFNLVPVNKR